MAVRQDMLDLIEQLQEQHRHDPSPSPFDGLNSTIEVAAFLIEQVRAGVISVIDEAEAAEVLYREHYRAELRNDARLLKALGYVAAGGRLREMAGRAKPMPKPKRRWPNKLSPLHQAALKQQVH